METPAKMAGMLTQTIRAVPVATIGITELLQLLWLIVALSLVYAATRHEQFRAIFPRAIRCAVKAAGVLLAALAVLILLVGQT